MDSLDDLLTTKMASPPRSPPRPPPGFKHLRSELIVNTPAFVSDRELCDAMGEHDKLIAELDELQAMRDRLVEIDTSTSSRLSAHVQHALIANVHAYSARMLECERLMKVIKSRSAYCAAERRRMKQVLHMRALPRPSLPPHWA